MTDRLDMIILGATGFTGMHCIPYIHKLLKSGGRNLTWGVAGRSEKKLKEVLKKFDAKADADLSKIPIIICDINDRDSLLTMAQKTKIVLNCCGPYQTLGEPVIKACIKAGTHHLDLSAEPFFIEKIALEYNEEAKRRGVYVVSACGYGSIPVDLGIIYLQNHFEGVLNSVVTYAETWEEKGSPSGSAVNYGTWHSIIYGLANEFKLKDIRDKLYPNKLPTLRPQLKKRYIPHIPSVVDGWALPFLPGGDRSVVQLTQRYFYEKENQRPIQVDNQYVVKSFMELLLYIFGGVFFLLFTQFSLGRKLLLKFPFIFSAGLIGKNPPSEEKMEKFWSQTTFYGKGWKQKLPNKNDQYTVPPNKAIIGRYKGRNPGYAVTCICLVGAAIMIATENNKLPNNGKGGVFTPGVAFAKTSLVELLKENEVIFEIISQKDI